MDVRKLMFGVVGLLVLMALGLGVWHLATQKSAPVRKAPKISLMPATPPPPPPPPKEERKVEPPKEQKEMRADVPTPPKDAPPAPPSQDLKMDGPAGDGPSAFSAGKITNDDLSNVGKAGAVAGGMFNPFNNYATLLKGELQRYLARNKDVRQRSYRVEVHVWVGRDGGLMRHEFIGSTGDADTDEALHKAIAALGTFTEVPPDRMPQPIRLRLVAGR